MYLKRKTTTIDPNTSILKGRTIKKVIGEWGSKTHIVFDDGFTLDLQVDKDNMIWGMGILYKCPKCKKDNVAVLQTTGEVMEGTMHCPHCYESMPIPKRITDKKYFKYGQE